MAYLYQSVVLLGSRDVGVDIHVKLKVEGNILLSELEHIGAVFFDLGVVNVAVKAVLYLCRVSISANTVVVALDIEPLMTLSAVTAVHTVAYCVLAGVIGDPGIVPESVTYRTGRECVEFREFYILRKLVVVVFVMPNIALLTGGKAFESPADNFIGLCVLQRRKHKGSLIVTAVSNDLILGTVLVLHFDSYLKGISRVCEQGCCEHSAEGGECK